MWIADWGKEPPHFPVDSIILRALDLDHSYTTMNRAVYDNAISLAKSETKKQESLAQWELEEYARRMRE
jgi:hypothetical protein